MCKRGLAPRFAASVQQQLSSITGAGEDADPSIRDLTALPWCSLANDDSLNLDQLSIDLTSLNPEQRRLALVTEVINAADASVDKASAYRAIVRNQAKLAHDAVAACIDGEGTLPDAARAVRWIDDQLRRQDAVAHRLRASQHTQGSLELETFAPRAVFKGERVVDIRQQVQNRARQLIEELMIATSESAARFPASRGNASLRCGRDRPLGERHMGSHLHAPQVKES